MDQKNTIFDDYKLTSSDKQAWWEYINYNLPPEYRQLASQYYNENYDPTLYPDYKPQDMDINDYFDIYDLPKVTALDGIIRVNGQQVATYIQHERWLQKRKFFAKLKLTPIYKEWRESQFECQYGRCAWCQKPIDLHSPFTHTDHILPLLWHGTNDFSNFVLSCARCNTEKKASTTGYNGAKGKPGENTMPNWIKPNPKTAYLCAHPEVVKEQVDMFRDADIHDFWRNQAIF